MDNLSDLAVEGAIGWLRRTERDSCWRVLTESKYPYATALSLSASRSEEREAAITYLVKSRVWLSDVHAARTLVLELIKRGEVARVGEIMALVKQDMRENHLPQAASRPDRLLRTPVSSPFKRVFLTLALSLVPSYYWHSRTSVLYDPFAAVAQFLSPNGWGDGEKIRKIMAQAVNSDGSYGGLTRSTLAAINAMSALGENEMVDRMKGWLERNRNEDGSLRIIPYQDVYDTLWACLGLSSCGENVTREIEWVEKTRVGDGYPWYSFSSFPDNDDTGLLVFLNGTLGYDERKSADAIRFLVKAQNPDGGWGFVPARLLSFGWTLDLLLRLQPVIERSHSPRLRSLMDFAQVSNFQSTAELTSRVIIALSYYKDVEDVKGAIRRGTAFLVRNFIGGIFHTKYNWMLSEVHETALSVVALHRCAPSHRTIDLALQWLCRDRRMGAEETAHVLWALNETRKGPDQSERLLESLLHIQRPDGSWEPSLPFTMNAPYLDPVFSTSTSLFAISKCKDSSVIPTPSS